MEQVRKGVRYCLALEQNSVDFAECLADPHSGSSIHAESNSVVFVRVVPGFLGGPLYSRPLMYGSHSPAQSRI